MNVASSSRLPEKAFVGERALQLTRQPYWPSKRYRSIVLQVSLPVRQKAKQSNSSGLLQLVQLNTRSVERTEYKSYTIRWVRIPNWYYQWKFGQRTESSPMKNLHWNGTAIQRLTSITASRILTGDRWKVGKIVIFFAKALTPSPDTL